MLKNCKLNDRILSKEIFLFSTLFFLTFIKVRSNFVFFAISNRYRFLTCNRYLIYMSKEADTREGWLVVAVAVVAVGAAVHPGLNLPPSSRERGLLL